jgi:hypothetical protein
LEISDSRFQISDLPPIYRRKTERAVLRRIIAKNLKSEIRKLKSSYVEISDSRFQISDLPPIYHGKTERAVLRRIIAKNLKSEIRKLKSNHKLTNCLTPKVLFFADNSAMEFLYIWLLLQNRPGSATGSMHTNISYTDSYMTFFLTFLKKENYYGKFC